MKKNKMMRLASGLLVAVLLTTCAISGTFAKYVTEASASDSARVAKWGVTVNAQGDAFSKEYASDTAGYAANTVISEAKVVAPGTTGELAEMTVTGTPEVAAKVTYKADLTLKGWQLADSTIYCPIVFTVEGTEYKMGDSITTLAALETAVENAIANCSREYPANVAINATNDAPSISWAWAYDTAETDGANDANDTYLGNQAANDAASRISLAITTTVTQID